MTRASVDLEQAKLDPASVFGAPEDVLAAPLSIEEKKAVLLRWEDDAEALIRATEEGMPPADNRNSAELLVAVHAALHELQGAG